MIKGKRKADVKSNNYFHYDDETVEKLELIRDAKSVGFTIQEIAQLMDAWYNNKISLAKKLSVLDEKLISIDDRIKQLKGMRKLLLQFKKDVQVDAC